MVTRMRLQISWVWPYLNKTSDGRIPSGCCSTKPSFFVSLSAAKKFSDKCSLCPAEITVGTMQRKGVGRVDIPTKFLVSHAQVHLPWSSRFGGENIPRTLLRNWRVSITTLGCNVNLGKKLAECKTAHGVTSTFRNLSVNSFAFLPFKNCSAPDWLSLFFVYNLVHSVACKKNRSCNCNGIFPFLFSGRWIFYLLHFF